MSSADMYLKGRPPPYTESDAPTTSGVVQQSGAPQVAIPVHVPNSMGPKTTAMTFPSWNQQIVTRVEHKVSKKTYLFVLLICVILALCVCCVLVLLYR